ncbi:MAG: hypothetical protein NZ988_05525 [Thaumarchaeota archaeon]|nr:hypothetical protein [Candidatus Calditenuaceae archaeon]MDW8187484.1 hypothetical protein [Nitrososphaerota archaeon]
MPEAWEVVSAVALFLFVLLLAMAIVGLADLMRLVGTMLRVTYPLSQTPDVLRLIAH